MTSAMKVKHQPRPIASIIGIITAACPAPSKHLQKLLLAAAVAGEDGSRPS